MSTLPSSLLLAQIPTTPTVPTQPTPPPPDVDGIPGGDATLYGGGAALALLFALVVGALARRRRKAKKAAEATARAELPPESVAQPTFRVELPPSEAEAARREEAEAKRREADALRAEREGRAAAARTASDAVERARLEEEARQLKEQEEALKRDEYRARKAAEEEARERRKREAEEAERLRREAEARAREEEAQRRAEAEAEARRKQEAEAGRTLSDGLDKTRSQGFMARLNTFFGAQKKVDESVLAELEEILFTADIGVRTASNLVELAREKSRRNELASSDRMKTLIRDEIARIVHIEPPNVLEGGGSPQVVMVVGVNGAGKTTTIGKLAAKAKSEGKRVVLAAGDTFRAAATEQLDVWAERAGAELITGKEGADPSSVVFEAVKRAVETGAQLVLADTAGRLHTKAPLMEELRKIKRVMDKALPGAPHQVLLVLDATMGQNAIAQAKQFHEAVGVTAIALTKLDGTAKGGVVIGISDELKIPVAFVGVGEKVADLRRFEPEEFVTALFE